MSCYAISARCQAYKYTFTFDPLFLSKATSIEGPTISSSSPAPSEILLLDQDQP